MSGHVCGECGCSEGKKNGTDTGEKQEETIQQERETNGDDN